MVREIIHDPLFLAKKSEKATVMDVPAALDLRDTLIFHHEGCVGLAANMIGISKQIIAFFDGRQAEIMLNPVILKESGPYEAEEGCLSLSGTRKTTRYRTIKVEYQTIDFVKKVKTYTGFPAQIIQHEVDHCKGILI